MISPRSYCNQEWGPVQHSYRTTRRGVYYYTTAGHGGYIIPEENLTAKERELLDKIGVTSTTYRSRRGQSGAYRAFEEDCAWALATWFLGVYHAKQDQNVSREHARLTILQWYPEVAKAFGVPA